MHWNQTKTFEHRFFEKVWFNPATGCMEWTAATMVGGYGVFHLSGANRGAHRVAYEWAVGPIPRGFHLGHSCGVRRCVNPEHMKTIWRAEHVLPRIGVTVRRHRTCWRIAASRG